MKEQSHVVSKQRRVGRCGLAVRLCAVGMLTLGLSACGGPAEVEVSARGQAVRETEPIETSRYFVDAGWFGTGYFVEQAQQSDPRRASWGYITLRRGLTGDMSFWRSPKAPSLLGLPQG